MNFQNEDKQAISLSKAEEIGYTFCIDGIDNLRNDFRIHNVNYKDIDFDNFREECEMTDYIICETDDNDELVIDDELGYLENEYYILCDTEKVEKYFREHNLISK